MFFSADKQTLDDLNIFGRHGSESISGIYNRCKTRGGGQDLEEMFRRPLADAALIGARVSTIKHLQRHSTPFPFSPADFDAAESYIAIRDDRTRLESSTGLAKRLERVLAPDTTVAVLTKGIHAIFRILMDLPAFLTHPGLVDNEAYREELQALSHILSESDFAPFLAKQAAGKYSGADLAEYDTLFRFRHRSLIEKLFRQLYRLDVYIAVGGLVNDGAYCFPEVRAAQAQAFMSINGFRHPAIPGAIGNDIEIGGHRNVLFLTGANMAGKSTLMKSLSLCVLLAHMGFPVCATSMRFSPLDGMYTTINLPDNLGMGASHFYAEVLRLKKVAQELTKGKRVFVLFDELFRGTNVKDAHDATTAVAEGFRFRQDSIFVLSTHIIEAGELLRSRCDNIKYAYMPTVMDGNTPKYTYQLTEGITADRHGMLIVRNEGILELLANNKR